MLKKRLLDIIQDIDLALSEAERSLRDLEKGRSDGGYIWDRFENVVNSLVASLDALKDAYEGLEGFNSPRFETYREAITYLKDSVDRLVRELESKCIRRGDRYICENIDGKEIIEDLRRVEKLIGIKCVTSENVNNIENIVKIVHSCIDSARKELSELLRFEEKGQCIYKPGSDSTLLKICEEWSKYLKKFENYFNIPSDSLTGVIEDDKAWFTVNPGFEDEIAMIDLRDESFTYSNPSRNVLDIVRMFVEYRLGGSCILSNSELTCKIPNMSEKISDIAYLLASLTGMGRRLEEEDAEAPRIVMAYLADRVNLGTLSTVKEEVNDRIIMLLGKLR